MRQNSLRVGDIVIDPRVSFRTITVGVTEIEYAHLFVPAELTEGFFLANGFRREEINTQVNFVRNEEGIMVVAHKSGESWYVEIRSTSVKLSGQVRFIHKFQHWLDDCRIKWQICG